MAIAGIDVGTTGCKCTICSNDGRILKETYSEYETEKNGDGRELDAWEVWNSVRKVVSLACHSVEEDIQAIGVTSFGETSVFVGEDDRPVLKSMLYVDPRGEEQCHRMTRDLGSTALFEITGVRPHPMYSISKIMWVAENHPALLNKTKRICLFGDYIVYLLSGNAQIDYSLACRTMAFDYRKLEWSDDILEYAKIDKKMLSEPVPTGSIAGRIKPELAEALGLSGHALIVTGCHDQIAAAVGTGCLREGMAVDGTGTVECITPVFVKTEKPDSLYENNYAIVPYVGENQYVTYAFSFNGGSLLKWYRDCLAGMEAQMYREQGASPYEEFNKRMNIEEPSGLLILPYFSGAATPYMDPDAKGAIIGLTDQTDSIDIYQGLMEGVTYEMMFNLECLLESGISVTELRATGGGAKAEEWLQMKADILNKKIISLGNAQSGTLGCIMMSGVACGVFRNLEEAADVFVQLGKTYEPNEERHEKYQKHYRRYRKLYRAVMQVMEDA